MEPAERFTDFEVDQEATDKTDETYTITNLDFLKAVFRGLPEDEAAILVRFRGDPKSVHGSAWSGLPWDGRDNEVDTIVAATGDYNAYFSLSSFRADENGKYSRKKGQFGRYHAVMLDDIGTKVPAERLTLEPSWLIETSPGNFQAGYILDEPITSGFVADDLMKSIISAGLCDQGADGPQARLARLPNGVNGKHTPPFACALKKWEPERRFTLPELVAGLNLKMGSIGKAATNLGVQSGHRSRVLHYDGVVHLPRTTSNPIIEALAEEHLYKKALGDGRHDITCPWVSEHSDEDGNGTTYFEPNPDYPVGGFHCFHGHCAHRNIKDLLEFLGIDFAFAKRKGIIKVFEGDLDRVVEAAEVELAKSGLFFQYGGLVVAVLTDPTGSVKRIQTFNEASLTKALAELVCWVKWDTARSRFKIADPPKRHVNILANSAEYKHLPVLVGLAQQPYLRPDLSLVTSDGYDPATRFYGVFNPDEFSIKCDPSKADAEKALIELQTLLAEFVFESPVDRAAAISAILAAVVRPSLRTAPLYHIRAHAAGSGKTCLAELICAFASYQSFSPTEFPSNEEEAMKSLLAKLMQGPPTVVFDNLTSDLYPYKSLCTALTSENLSGRVLGQSKIVTVSTRALFVSTGNNIEVVGDMTRRTVRVNLDPGVESPATRTFKRPELISDLLRERGRYVSIALTIILAWVRSGCPKQEGKPLVGYKDWSDLCRQPLLWLGLADPAIGVFEAIEEDPDRELLGRFLHAWLVLYDDEPMSVRKLLDRPTNYQDATSVEMDEVIKDIAEERGKINRWRLGQWLKRSIGQVVDGLLLDKVSGSRSAMLLRLARTEKV